MKTVDIMETIAISIEEKILKEWKHEGLIEGYSAGHINFDIDQKEYVLLIREIGEGEHFSQMRIRKEE